MIGTLQQFKVNEKNPFLLFKKQFFGFVKTNDGESFKK